MEENNTLSSQIKRIFDELKLYLDLRIGLLKLNVAEYLIKFFSTLVMWMVVFLFLFFVLVFGSFAFAYWFGDIFGEMWLGFIIIAGFYIVLAVIIYWMRKIVIVKPFTNLILSQMELDDPNDEKDE